MMRAVSYNLLREQQLMYSYVILFLYITELDVKLFLLNLFCKNISNIFWVCSRELTSFNTNLKPKEFNMVLEILFHNPSLTP